MILLCTHKITTNEWKKQSSSLDCFFPSAVLIYPKFQQMSAESKRKTKFLIFCFPECSANLSKITTNECRIKKKNKVFHFCYAECSANLSKISTKECSNKRLWMIKSVSVRCCYKAFKKNGLYLMLLIAYRLFSAIGMRWRGRTGEAFCCYGRILLSALGGGGVSSLPGVVNCGFCCGHCLYNRWVICSIPF